MTDLPKTFDPAAIEAKWYAHWERTGAFRPSRPDAEPYTIVMPPPNVTGSLHIGHALDNTLQDILIRHARLQGKDALWVVGTDHAGIATQMVVERQMALHQDKRTDFTRDEFIDKVWEWKAESGGTITSQLRRLGASCDWANERFTMDEGFSKAVTKVFVDLYNQGLLYRDKRLVNWDPHFKTAISDLEVETREVNGHMWHFKYPLADGETYTYVERDDAGNVTLSEERDYISIATTRPETMLGDGAVAVHPGDQRYKPIIGKLCEIPVGPKEHRRLIPIITDEYPDPGFGSGAVKITGAHDQNDYSVAQRNGIPMYRLMDENAAMRTDGMDYASTAEQAKAIAGGETASTSEVDALNLVPEAYRGLDRYEARKRVVADIDADGLMLRVEDKTIQQPFGDRSGVVIEPMLTDQWYVDAKTLAGPAIDAVRSGAIKVVPKTWEKTYFNWMENIQPWCVSRQLWWGHRIPAWYGPSKIDGKIVHDEEIISRSLGTKGFTKRISANHVFVAETEHDALFQAQDYYGSDTKVYVGDKIQIDGSGLRVRLVRDEDVLDTWFSSALWPFGTLGWPDSSPLAGEERDLATQEPSRSGEGAVGVASELPTTPSPAATKLAQEGSLSLARSPARGEGGVPSSLLTRHYPNDVLISGFDILFFWDARMIMQGLHFMKEVPWKTLYLHGLVRAADGSKMSKSKGNTVDPLGLIDQYGADALRFTLTAMESQGRDIKLDEKRVEGYRNFATKLWNAARFCQANGIGASTSVAAPSAELPVNRWIIGEVVTTLAKLDAAIADLRFDAMADTIYHFAWGTFCDWYLELIKPQLDTSRDSTSTSLELDERAHECKQVAGWVFDQIIVMLHPFMPFITEELWQSMGSRPCDLIHAHWPAPGVEVDINARRQIEWVIELVQSVRSTRNDLNIPPSVKLNWTITQITNWTWDAYFANQPAIRRLARIDQTGLLDSLQGLPGRNEGWGPYVNMVHENEMAKEGTMQIVASGFLAFASLDSAIDLTAERARLTKAIESVGKDRDSLASRLNNPSFIERAKPEAVEKARADYAEKAAEAERLSAALARLG